MMSQDQRCSIPPKSPNGNGTGFQWAPIENPLNADVAPVADPFFQPLLKMQRVLNLRLNLLNCNGFSTGQPLQPVAVATGAVFDD